LAASTLITLFLEMLKFSNSFVLLKEKKLTKKILNRAEYSIFQFENLKMNSNIQQTYVKLIKLLFNKILFQCFFKKKNMKKKQ
jgi:hypothetical protein